MSTIEELKAERDVKGLIDLLKNSMQLHSIYDPNNVFWAVRALGEIGDAQAVEPLLDILRLDYDSWREAQTAALEALRNIGVLAVESLVYALQDGNRDIRWSAAVVLGRIGDMRAIKPLLSALEVCADDTSMQEAIVNALEKIGVSACEPIIAALQDSPHAHVRENAALALGRLRDTRAVEPLINALQDSNNIVRRVAASKLGVLGDARAVEPLIAALQDEDDDVRRVTALVLGEIRDARASEPLTVVFQNEKELVGVRKAAAKALHSLKIDILRMALIKLRCIHCGRLTEALLPDNALERPKDPEIKCENCGKEFTFTADMTYTPKGYV